MLNKEHVLSQFIAACFKNDDTEGKEEIIEALFDSFNLDTEEKLQRFSKYLRVTDDLFTVDSLAPIYDTLIEAGVLSDKDLYLISDKLQEIPCLVIPNWGYLSWFRGYGFQVSGDEDGGGDCGSSYGTVFMKNQLSKITYLVDKTLKHYIIFSHIFSALTMNFRFKKLDIATLIEKNQNVFNEWLQQTCNFMGCNTLTYQDFINSFKVLSEDEFNSKYSGSKTVTVLTDEKPSLVTSYTTSSCCIKDLSTGKFYEVNIPKETGDIFDLSEEYEIAYSIYLLLASFCSIQTHTYHRTIDTAYMTNGARSVYFKDAFVASSNSVTSHAKF